MTTTRRLPKTTISSSNTTNSKPRNPNDPPSQEPLPQDTSTPNTAQPAREVPVIPGLYSAATDGYLELQVLPPVLVKQQF